MRQYIGARYITKIYQNSQDPGSCEWEPGVVYESLTIVSYQNSSYISRTEVPANAGAPTLATQYWAQTGFYNGQIAQLQSEIDDINIDVDHLKIITDHKYVMIGDSFGARPGGWISYLKNKLTLTEGSNVFSNAAGGSGFCNPTTFITLLNTLAASMTDAQKNSITDIITVGGINDTYGAYVQSTISNDVETYCERVIELFPNAKRHMIFYNATFNFPWLSEYDRRQYKYRTRNGIMDGVKSSGKINAFYQGAENMLNYSGYVDTTDGVHLTSDGEDAYNGFIFNAITGGRTIISLRNTTRGISFIFTDSGVIAQVNIGIVYNDLGSPLNFTAGQYTVIANNVQDLPYYKSIMIPIIGVLTDTSAVAHNFTGALRINESNQTLSICSDTSVSSVGVINISGIFTSIMYYD